jgi:hypothetical protein
MDGYLKLCLSAIAVIGTSAIPLAFNICSYAVS